MNIKDEFEIVEGMHLDMQNEPGIKSDYFYWGKVEKSDIIRLRREIRKGNCLWRNKKETRFLLCEKYSEKATGFFCGYALGTIKKWTFCYPDGTEEVLTMEVSRIQQEKR